MNAHNPTVIEAAAWRKNAELTDCLVVNTEADRQALRDWSRHCRMMADELEAAEIKEFCK